MRTKKNKIQKWMVLEAKEGWQIILPTTDSHPHGYLNEKTGNIELSFIVCSCDPKVDFKSKTIIHNSFLAKEIFEKNKFKGSVVSPYFEKNI